MPALVVQIAVRLAFAWGGGALIGAERSFHGRAGFRTHSLVAIAAASAVLAGFGDPNATSRLGQGVLTGVGFLGAGVIFKEGVNVQGLTTAASIWVTAAIGLLFGSGDFASGGLATGAALVTLIILRWIEDTIPTRIYALSRFRWAAAEAPDRAALDALLAKHGVTLREVSYGRLEGGASIEVRGTIAATSDQTLDRLADALRQVDGLKEFELARVST